MALETSNRWTRTDALALLEQNTEGTSLRKHALAVETCTRAYGAQEADRLGLVGDEKARLIERYAVTALLHDFDYEKHPSLDEHPYVGVALLAELGWPQEIREAILGHAEYTGVPRSTHLARALFACDELSGLLTACALVKPTRHIADVDVAGVRKKMKDKAFARGVNREDVTRGAEELGVPLDEHIAFCLRAMQDNAEALGL